MLQVISYRKDISPTEISTYSGTSLPSITDILDGLNKLHYIHRSRSKKDRRKVKISISEEGTTKLLEFQKLQQSFIEMLEKSLKDDDLEALSKIIETMVKSLAHMDYLNDES